MDFTINERSMYPVTGDSLSFLPDYASGHLDRVAAMLPPPAPVMEVGPVDTVSLVHNLPFEVSLVALLAAYCFVIYYYRGCILSLLRLMHNKAYAEKVYAEQTFFFRVFLRLMGGLGVWVYSMAIVKAVDMIWGIPVTAALPPWAVQWMVVFVAVAVALVEVCQRVAIGLIGAVTRDTGTIGPLLYMRRVLNATAVVLLTPLLVFCLSPGAGEAVFAAGGSVVVAGLLLLFFVRSYVFFARRGVSILNWFLYLCAVEWFPVSFFVLAIVRNL